MPCPTCLEHAGIPKGGLKASPPTARPSKASKVEVFYDDDDSDVSLPPLPPLPAPNDDARDKDEQTTDPDGSSQDFCTVCGEDYAECACSDMESVYSLFEDDYMPRHDLERITPMPALGLQLMHLPDDIITAIFLALHPEGALAFAATSRSLAAFADQRGGLLWKRYIEAKQIRCYIDELEHPESHTHRNDVEYTVEALMCRRCRRFDGNVDEFRYSDYSYCPRCIEWLYYKNAKAGNVSDPAEARMCILQYRFGKKGMPVTIWEDYQECWDHINDGTGDVDSVVAKV